MFGVLSTYEKSAYGYYIVKFVSIPYTMQDETFIDGNIIMSGERVVN